MGAIRPPFSLPADSGWAVECAVAQSFRDVHGFDALRLRHVRERACDAQTAVVGAGGEQIALQGGLQEIFCFSGQMRMAFERASGQRGIGVALPLQLKQACLADPFGNGRRVFLRCCGLAQGAGFDTADEQLQVDAVEKRA